MSDGWANLAGMIERGGVVMIPLLGLSVVSLTLIIERAWFWWSTNRPGRQRRCARLIHLLTQGDARIGGMIGTDRWVYGSVARSIIRGGATDVAALTAVEAVRPRLERYMVTLSTIITAAPLLGILGTVLGIIDSFDLLGQQEVLTDPRGVSEGIAEALLTTALGLVVALATLFPYMIFRGQLDRTLGRLEAIVAAAQHGSAIQGSTETAAGGSPKRDQGKPIVRSTADG